MPPSNETKNLELYDFLDAKGFNPISTSGVGKSVDTQLAKAFNFTFKVNNKEYGTFIASIDNSTLIIFFSKQAVNPVMSSWAKFLEEIKNKFIGQSGIKNFKVDAIDKYDEYLARREFNENLNEGYYGNKHTSYSNSTPSTVKMFIRHNKTIEENDQRFRHVEQIFVENQLGERFVLPTKKPSEGYVFARHIADGGNPYDERGKHIAQMCEDIKKLGGFLRATRNNQFNESVDVIIHEAAGRYLDLRETMKKLRSSRGYRDYFENWTPTLMEENSDNVVAELFTQQRLDPRIESALPVLNRLKLNNSIIEDVDSDVDLLDEDLIPTQPGDIEELIQLLSDQSDPLFLGPDATNAIGQIKDYIEDSVLFNRLKNASGNPDTDAKTIIIAWMKEQPDNENLRKVLDGIEEKKADTNSTSADEKSQLASKIAPKSNKDKQNAVKDIPPNATKTSSLTPGASASGNLPEAPPLEENIELSRIRKLSGIQK